MFDPDILPLDAERAFRRYEGVRARLPSAHFPSTFERVQSLADLTDLFDVFVLDAYGVLNVGPSAVPGAPGRIADLQAAGKTVLILTNGASFPLERSVQRYRSLGYAMKPENVVASREAALAAVVGKGLSGPWGVAAHGASALESCGAATHLVEDDPVTYESAEAFLLLSSIEWTFERHRILIEALTATPRPVIVGNPDLIAPQEGGFSLEPGFYAHDIADRLGIEPEFHGKPFPSVFNLVKARLPAGTDPQRVAMVGDTLHTDILGGAAAGWKTVLVSDHGLFKGADSEDYIGRSGIVPDFVANTT